MNAPIQIRREEVIQNIRELAALKAQPMTEVIAQLVEAELRRERARGNIQQRREAIEKLVHQFNELPIVGPILTDDDLYDADGLPR